MINRPTLNENDVSAKNLFQAASAAPQPEKTKYPRITLRLSEDELTRLKTLSQGMTLSAYIRKCLFGKNVTLRKVRNRAPVKDQKSLARVLGLLGETRIANNLNQIAYEANCGSLLLDEQTEIRLNEASKHVFYIRKELVKALGLSDHGAL